MVICYPKLQKWDLKKFGLTLTVSSQAEFLPRLQSFSCFFLNLHFFYCNLQSYFFIHNNLIPLPPPTQKNLKPLLLPFPFVKEILQDWKWKYCTRCKEFQSGCVFWHPYMQRKIKLLTSIKAFITAVAKRDTSSKPPCTGIQAVIDINSLVWLE